MLITNIVLFCKLRPYSNSDKQQIYSFRISKSKNFEFILPNELTFVNPGPPVFRIPRSPRNCGPNQENSRRSTQNFCPFFQIYARKFLKRPEKLSLGTLRGHKLSKFSLLVTFKEQGSILSFKIVSKSVKIAQISIGKAKIGALLVRFLLFLYYFTQIYVFCLFLQEIYSKILKI